MPWRTVTESLAPTPSSCTLGIRTVSLQVVAQRMKSVGNIQKITAAMKMVAASRLKGAQTKMETSRGLVQPLFRLLGDIPGRLACSAQFQSLSNTREVLITYNSPLI